MKNFFKLFSIVCCSLLLNIALQSKSLAQNNEQIEALNSIDGNISKMVGQMILCGFKGHSIEDDPAMYEAIKEGKIGGVIFFYKHKDIIDYNIKSPQQVTQAIAEIQNLSPYPIFISIDQEGGMVQRISSKNGFKDYPSAYELGQESVKNTLKSAKILAADLKNLGFNLNFAPVVDVHNPKSLGIGRYERAFHKDPRKVSKYAQAFIEGMESENIIPSIKHFPGHGNATNDTHDGFTDITDTWKKYELLPYKNLIDDGYSGIVMTAHVYHAEFDDKPATLSYNVITKLLRERLGFEGVVTTDDLQMGAIRNLYTLEETILYTINAGVDILLFGNNLEYDPNLVTKIHETTMKLISEGKISEERIEESWQRIKKLKLEYLIEG